MNAEWFVKRLCEAVRGLPVAGALLAAVALAFPGAPASAADSFSTDWAEAAKSQARLIAGVAGLKAIFLVSALTVLCAAIVARHLIRQPLPAS